MLNGKEALPEGEDAHGRVERLEVLLERLLRQQRLHPLREQPREQVDLLEHAEQVAQARAERVEAAEDVLLAEAELADLAADLAVLDPRVGVLVALVQLDALHQLLLDEVAVLVPDRLAPALRDVALAGANDLKMRYL